MQSSLLKFGCPVLLLNMGAIYPSSQIDELNIDYSYQNNTRSIELLNESLFNGYIANYNAVFSHLPALASQQDFEQKIKIASFKNRRKLVPEKILELASDQRVGNDLSVVLASLAVIEHSEFKNELAQSLTSLKEFYASINQPRMTLLTADVVGEATKKAMRGNHLQLRLLRTGLLVLSEVILEDPAVATLIAQSIKSKDDFWLWIKFLSLPGKGWVGPTIPIPLPTSSCADYQAEHNAGTDYEFSLTPCRINGQLVSLLINEWLAKGIWDNEQPEQISADLSVMMSSLIGSSIEFNRYLFEGKEGASQAFNVPFISQAHAAVWYVWAARGAMFNLGVMTKLIKKHGKNHIINFVRNGTTSRVDPVEFLGVIAYLTLRKPGCDERGYCSKALNEQVYEATNANIAKWIAGVALSSKGIIGTDNDEAKQNTRQCMVDFRAHGAAFELQLTAFYHALYEFAPTDIGKKYEIIAADDAENQIPIPLFATKRSKKEVYNNTGYKRRPDFILAGDDSGDTPQRIWVEAKSWLYNEDNYKNKELVAGRYPLWEPESTAGYKNNNANRQFFLDRSAASTFYATDFWKKNESDQKFKVIKNYQPAQFKWWFQSWNFPEKRRYYQYDKNGKRVKGKNPTYINVATGWVKPGAPLTSHFKAMQTYLSTKPELHKKVLIDQILGSTDSYQQRVVGNTSVIAPFDIKNAFKEVVDTDILKAMLQDVLPEEYLALRDGAELTETMKNQLKQLVDAKIDETFGIVQTFMGASNILSLGIPSYLEGKVAEQMDGEYVQQYISENMGNINLGQYGIDTFSCEIE